MISPVVKRQEPVWDENCELARQRGEALEHERKPFHGMQSLHENNPRKNAIA